MNSRIICIRKLGSTVKAKQSRQAAGMEKLLDKVDNETILDENFLPDVMDAIVRLASKYYSIGLCLRLRCNDLDDIRDDHGRKVKEALEQVLKSWLALNYDYEKYGMPTWRKLVEAAYKRAAGNNCALAKVIADAHPMLSSGSMGHLSTSMPQAGSNNVCQTAHSPVYAQRRPLFQGPPMNTAQSSTISSLPRDGTHHANSAPMHRLKQPEHEEVNLSNVNPTVHCQPTSSVSFQQASALPGGMREMSISSIGHAANIGCELVSHYQPGHPKSSTSEHSLSVATVQEATVQQPLVQGSKLYKSPLQEVRVEESDLQAAIEQGDSLHKSLLQETIVQETIVQESPLQGAIVQVGMHQNGPPLSTQYNLNQNHEPRNQLESKIEVFTGLGISCRQDSYDDEHESLEDVRDFVQPVHIEPHPSQTLRLDPSKLEPLKIPLEQAPLSMAGNPSQYVSQKEELTLAQGIELPSATASYAHETQQHSKEHLPRVNTHNTSLLPEVALSGFTTSTPPTASEIRRYNLESLSDPCETRDMICPDPFVYRGEDKKCVVIKGGKNWDEYHPYIVNEKNQHLPISLSSGKISPNLNKKISNPVLPEYPMNATPHGIAVIINNEKFMQHATREGTEVDAIDLVTTFRYLGYIVRVYTDCTAAEMSDIFNEMKNCDHSNYDSFVCCILSHGSREGIFGSDSDIVTLKSLTQCLTAESCPKLAGKPKLFFLQACRGTLKTKGVAIDGENKSYYAASSQNTSEVVTSSLPNTSGVETDNITIIPEITDFIFAFATPQGRVSYRDMEDGAWYIRELCNVLCMYSTWMSLVDMIMLVAKQVCENKEYQFMDNKQAPETTIRMRNKVYFHSSSDDHSSPDHINDCNVSGLWSSDDPFPDAISKNLPQQDYLQQNLLQQNLLQHESTQHYPTQQGPSQQDPLQHDPTQQDPSQQVPTQHDPTQQGPFQQDLTQLDPTQQGPSQQVLTQHDPTKQCPSQQGHSKHDSTQQDPTQRGPSQQDPTQQGPTQEGPSQQDPTQGDPTQQDSTQQGPTQHDLTQQGPSQQDPTQQGPSQQYLIQQGPYQQDPTLQHSIQLVSTQLDPNQQDLSKPDPLQLDSTQLNLNSLQQDSTQVYSFQQDPLQKNPSLEDCLSDSRPD